MAAGNTLTTNYSWAFPNIETDLASSNPIIEGAFEGIDQQVFSMELFNKLNEGGNDGYRVLGFNSTYYGDIGLNALDLSYATEGTLNGATGDYSTAFGYNVIANSYGGLSVGKYNTGNATATFEVGMGTADGDRKNAITVWDNGTVSAPESTISSINTRGAKAVITKEYIEDYVSSPTLVESWVVDTEPNNGEIFIIDSSVAVNAVLLPVAPANGFKVTFLDDGGNASVNSLTVKYTNGSNTIMGLGEDFVIDIDNARLGLIYVASSTDWRII